MLFGCGKSLLFDIFSNLHCHFTGPHDGNPENDTVLLASNTLPSDFVLTPTPEKISRHDEPHNFYSGNDTVPTVSNAVGSDIVLTSLKSSSRDGEPSYGISLIKCS